MRRVEAFYVDEGDVIQFPDVQWTVVKAIHRDIVTDFTCLRPDGTEYNINVDNDTLIPLATM